MTYKRMRRLALLAASSAWGLFFFRIYMEKDISLMRTGLFSLQARGRRLPSSRNWRTAQ